MSENLLLMSSLVGKDANRGLVTEKVPVSGGETVFELTSLFTVYSSVFIDSSKYCENHHEIMLTTLFYSYHKLNGTMQII